MAETYRTVWEIFGFSKVRPVCTLDTQQRTQHGQHDDDREAATGSERAILVKCIVIMIRNDTYNM
jgi:hypothetical protein